MFGFYTLDRPSGQISNSGQELHFGFLAMHWYRPQNIIRLISALQYYRHIDLVGLFALRSFRSLKHHYQLGPSLNV